MMDELFKQCVLQRCIDGNVETVISWVPERLAVPGGRVCMKDPDEGLWTEGWIVMATTEPAWPAAYLVRASGSREIAWCG
jgi:hypothetical protein